MDEQPVTSSSLHVSFGDEWTAPVRPEADEALDPVLSAAIAPVLRDLRSTGGPEPRIAAEEWGHAQLQVTATLWSTVGRSAGVSVRRDSAAAERVVEAADGVQEWAVETLWQQRLPTGWPACPVHPTTHPLTPELRGDAPSWCCPATSAAVAPIGALPPA